MALHFSKKLPNRQRHLFDHRHRDGYRDVQRDDGSSQRVPARLTASETGGFQAVSESGPLPATALLPVTDGTATAVWEITDDNPNAINSVEFGVYVSFSGNAAAGSPALGTATVNGSLAPTSDVSSASTGPIPRFGDTSSARNLFSVTSCSGAAAVLVAAVLPSSRLVQVGSPATAFATIINAGSSTATGCGISPLTGLLADFSFRPTNSANQVIGTLNTPVDIAAGAAQNYVFALSPQVPIPATDVQLRFDCSNTAPAAVHSGLNTFLFSASPTLVPDIVALGATLNNDGIVTIPGTVGIGVFAVATVNVGAGGTITASADTGSANGPWSSRSVRPIPQPVSVWLRRPAPSRLTSTRMRLLRLGFSWQARVTFPSTRSRTESSCGSRRDF